jgi:hypothetical protein
MKAEEHAAVSIAAAELAAVRARARAIVACRFLTPAARVAMLRVVEAELLTALRQWRALSGIAPIATDLPSTARIGPYRRC